METASPSNDFEEKLVKNIGEHGYHINVVKDPDGKEPIIVYTIGFWKTWGHPELIILGLHHEPAIKIVRMVADTLASCGLHLKDEEFRDDFLPDFECLILSANPELFEEYLLSAVWLYQGNDFPVFQILYQDETGHWPWDAEASDQIKWSQPVLATD